jgi:hypothetical protein
MKLRFKQELKYSLSLFASIHIQVLHLSGGGITGSPASEYYTLYYTFFPLCCQCIPLQLFIGFIHFPDVFFCFIKGIFLRAVPYTDKEEKEL